MYAVLYVSIKLRNHLIYEWTLTKVTYICAAQTEVFLVGPLRGPHKSETDSLLKCFRWVCHTLRVLKQSGVSSLLLVPLSSKGPEGMQAKTQGQKGQTKGELCLT